MLKKFDGELEWINPKFLVNETSFNKLESFFIGLGVVFNDLKGLLLFEKLLTENYEKPSIGEVTSHAGNYGGVLVQTQKLVASTISEFFIFLKKNNDVFSENEFKDLLKKLPKSHKQLWDSMVAAAHGRVPAVNGLLKTLVLVRSNIAFHYDHSGKILRNAYISRFFGKDKEDRSKYAYYSIGNTVDSTRFYFSDAAVEESLHIAAGKKFKETSSQNMSLAQYRKQVIDTINVMNPTIAKFIKIYLNQRRNLPHQ